MNQLYTEDRSGTLEDLIPFFNKKISSLERKQRDWFKAKSITGLEFKDCWTIAGVDYKTLRSTYLMYREDLGLLTSKLKGLLLGYRSILIKVEVYNVPLFHPHAPPTYKIRGGGLVI